MIHSPCPRLGLEAALAKKIERYVPATKYPARGHEWRLFDKAGTTPDQFVAYIDELNRLFQERTGQAGRYYGRVAETLKVSGRQGIADWQYRRLCKHLFHLTPMFKEINDKFMAEYDSRDDLQEIYRECYQKLTVVYSASGEMFYTSDGRYSDRPETFLMYRYAIGLMGQSEIEAARQTPFVEGDLVMLRDTEVDRDDDPLRIVRWTERWRNGERTPDASTSRIGTVMGVTDRVDGNRRGVKGKKLIKVLWLGVEDSQIVEVQERHLKWHERPTRKNGLRRD